MFRANIGSVWNAKSHKMRLLLATLECNFL
jgi:hypothetical protein